MNVPAILASVVLTTLPILVLQVLGRRTPMAGRTAGFSVQAGVRPDVQGPPPRRDGPPQGRS